ncbi:MAG: T9SS type A sorting domain-containing protein [Candidatus Cloacimonetes bacterium]|nr:T9SS type A sorting domain-containing protein [Candidatus Cloacimonadota bacterium]
MNKLITPLLLMLLPVVIFAGVFDNHSITKFNLINQTQRAYRLTGQLTSYWSDSEWRQEIKVVPFYNATNFALMDSLHIDSYDYENGVWIPRVMCAYFEYNAAGYITTNQINSSFGADIPMMLSTSVYDGQNRLVNLSSYENVSESPIPIWQPDTRQQILYGAGTTFEVYGWEAYGGGEYREPNFNHVTFSFDANGRMQEDVNYSSPDSVNWQMSDKREYTYHAQDTSTGADLIHYIAQNLPMMFINDGFEAPGKILSETSYYWYDSDWYPDYRNLNEYNAQLLLTEVLNQGYDSTDWTTWDRKQYYYDANSNLSYTIGQDYFMGTFENNERTDYTWGTYSATQDNYLPPISDLRVNIYPSPFATSVSIAPESKSISPIQMQIYNVKGQLLNQANCYNGEKYSWNGKDLHGNSVGVGIYFVKCTQDGISSSGKMIKLR